MFVIIGFLVTDGEKCGDERTPPHTISSTVAADKIYFNHTRGIFIMSTTFESIRNIAVVGHSGEGKTTLVEAMLFNGGVIDRMVSRI